MLLVVWAIALYNGLVRTRNRVDNAWAQIDVQLKRRHDLIPNLVETVKGYAAHERGTFEAVTQARAAASRRAGPGRDGAAEGMLSQALGRLFAVAEAYPDLKANQNFLDLQAAAAGHRGQDRVSRQVYNDTVLTYNNAIQVFPAVLIAGLLGFTKREFFEIENAGDREVPAVSFGPPPATPLPRVPHYAPPGCTCASDASAAPPRRRAGGARARGRRRREVVLAPAGECHRRGGERRRPRRRRAHHRTRSPGRSPAATGTSRFARASPSTDVRRPRTAAPTGRGCTELGCFDAPGTYGVAAAQRPHPHRLALQATDEARTFESATG